MDQKVHKSTETYKIQKNTTKYEKVPKNTKIYPT